MTDTIEILRSDSLPNVSRLRQPRQGWTEEVAQALSDTKANILSPGHSSGGDVCFTTFELWIANYNISRDLPLTPNLPLSCHHRRRAEHFHPLSSFITQKALIPPLSALSLQNEPQCLLILFDSV
jgi:hypothetical protein